MKAFFFYILFAGIILGIGIPSAYAQAPPDPPKLFNGTVTPSTGISFLWTDGDTNGDPHDDFTLQRLKLDGITWESLTTTTNNNYFDNQPLQNDTAKYRIRDNGSLGFGCYQFAMNTTVTSNLQSYFPFCDTMNDNGILNNDGAITGNELYDNDSGIISFDFDGSSYVTLPNESDYDFEHTDPFSVSFWVNFPANANGRLVQKDNSLTPASIGWGVRSAVGGSAPVIDFTLEDGTTTFMARTSPVPLNTWTHVIGTYSGNSNQDGLKVYLNGVLEDTGSSSAISSTILNNDPVVIGAESDGGNPWTGRIYDVTILDKELDSNEVAQLHGEYIDTSTLAMKPNAVTDLTAVSAPNLSTVNLSWSTPFVFGGVDGYQINYTTPLGDPQTILAGANNTESADTTAAALGLVIGEPYSFRVSAWNDFGNNATGNISNATTETSFEIGDFSNPDVTNTDDFSIFFDRSDINSTALWLNVTYPNTYNLECNMYYEFARTNNTYSGLASEAVDPDNVMSSFLFVNSTGDIVDVTCTDTITNDSSNYVLTITQFPFLDQIDNMRNGTYGTYFEIGAIDGISLMIIFIGMIGFNRTSPIVGVMFISIATLALSFFGIITYPFIMYPALVLMMFWAFISTRKDD